MPSTGPAALASLAVLLVMGALLGLLGAAYNGATLGALWITDRLRAVPSLLRTGLIGAGIGLMVWFAPGLAGGGEDLTAAVLAGRMDWAALAFVLALRFVVRAGLLCGRHPRRSVHAAADAGGRFRRGWSVGTRETMRGSGSRRGR